MKILTPRFSSNRSASSSPSSSNDQFHNSPFKIPGSDCVLVRGVPCSSTNSRAAEEESKDEESVFNASSEELLPEEDFYIEEAEVQSGKAEGIDSFRSEFANLFLSPEKKELGKAEANSIPRYLVSFIEACDIKLICDVREEVK